MIHSEATIESLQAQTAAGQPPAGDVAGVAAQLELLALNSAIASCANSEGPHEAAQQLADLDQVLREVRIAVAWQPGEVLEAETLGRELSQLAQRLTQAVGSFNR